MIREAEPKDIKAIMRLLHQVNDVHADGRPDLFIKGGTKYTPQEVERIIDDPTTPIFIFADENDEVAGYCFCIIQDHTQERNLTPIKTLYIDDLCIDAERRGQHIGRRIYDYVRNYAKTNGFHNVTLNVWVCNPSAVGFYESLGLTPFKIGMEEIL